MSGGWSSLLSALSDPSLMVTFGADDWDLVVRQASSAGLLGRLGAQARHAGIEDALPRMVRRHFGAVLTIAGQQQRAVRWELEQLTRAVAEIDGPIVLLKGAAYAAADLPPAAGRLFSDIDVLVPKRQIDAVESALMLDGWATSNRSAYDQRYYRQWMHEIPPMTHIRRQTVLDLHHNILPETARIRTRPDLIIERAQRLPEFPRFGIPAPADLVLHSATHLFHEGEWAHGLRDLADLDAMLRDFGHRPDFWPDLIERSGQMNLGRPLYYGLRYCAQLLRTPVPADLFGRIPGQPSAAMTKAMDRLFLPALSTCHQSCRLPGAGAASFALYVRSHWLRMPPHLLAPHLARKFWDDTVVALMKSGDANPKARGQ